MLQGLLNFFFFFKRDRERKKASACASGPGGRGWGRGVVGGENAKGEGERETMRDYGL